MEHSAHRFLGTFFLVAVLALVPAVLVSLYLGPAIGDLARVGYFANRDFGARAPQPLINRLAAPGLHEPADVLLIGDSFSLPNLWQSELTRNTGRRVVTWHFKWADCMGDWIEQAIAGQLRAGTRTVIVETVEREFFKRFDDKPGCAKTFYPPYSVDVGIPKGLAGFGVFPMDIRHVTLTAGNYLRTRDISGRYQSAEVVSVDLARDDLFSNRLRDRLLYYSGDERKMQKWSEPDAVALLDRLAQWRARAAAAGVQLHFMIIPDKSSVYWPYIKPGQQPPYPERGERLFTLIEERFGADHNLLPWLREQALHTVDLYAPSDSHLANGGYQLLAGRVEQWLASDAAVRGAASATK